MSNYYEKGENEVLTDFVTEYVKGKAEGEIKDMHII